MTCAPIRPGTGRNLAGDLDNYIMVEASAKSKLGRDLTTGDTPVHFDYGTGSLDAKEAREVTDFSTHCAHLWTEAQGRAARSPGGGWRGDITPNGAANADLIPDYDASAAKYGGPGSPPGYDSWIDVFDSLGDETSSRPLYEALYRFEIKKRLEPRKLLYVTPCDGDKSIFTAPRDFDAFDLVQIKAEIGKSIDEGQRVYGYTKTWTRENVASIGQLLTSADVTWSDNPFTAINQEPARCVRLARRLSALERRRVEGADYTFLDEIVATATSGAGDPIEFTDIDQRGRHLVIEAYLAGDAGVELQMGVTADGSTWHDFDPFVDFSAGVVAAVTVKLPYYSADIATLPKAVIATVVENTGSGSRAPRTTSTTTPGRRSPPAPARSPTRSRASGSPAATGSCRAAPASTASPDRLQAQIHKGRKLCLSRTRK